MKFTSCCVTAAIIISSALSSNASADNDNAAIRQAKMNYPINVIAQNYTDSEGVLLQGFLSTPNTTTTTKKIPAVVIMNDSSGTDAYEKQRATMIANELGYVAFAADTFGVETEIPVDTGGWGGPYADFISTFIRNATLFTQRIAAAVDHVQSLPNVDETKVAILGFCLGGTGVVHYINVAGEKVGGAAAAVSIHPSLLGAWDKPLGKINIPSIFLTGGNDFLTGPQAMASLEGDMTSASTVQWETNRYAKIDHAFTNWFAETAYNARADERSWNSMRTFLADKFGQSDDSSYSWESASQLDLESEDCCEGVAFVDHGPDEEGRRDFVVHAGAKYGCPYPSCKVPTVIILPDKSESGRLFAKQRAMQIAQRYGYATWVSEGNVAARQYFEGVGYIDSEKVALEGYGSGAQDALDFAMGGNIAGIDGDQEYSFKVISIFEVPENITAVNDTALTYKPQILISSGVDGDNMADVIALESTLMGMEANYEINRYSDASTKFTDWNDLDGSYNAHAAERSFETVESIYREMFGEFYWEIPPQTESPTPVPPSTQAPAPSGASLSTVTTASSCALLAVAYFLSM